MQLFTNRQLSPEGRDAIPARTPVAEIQADLTPAELAAGLRNGHIVREDALPPLQTDAADTSATIDIDPDELTDTAG